MEFGSQSFRTGRTTNIMIRLQTSKGREIPNNQDFEIPAYQRNWVADLPGLYPRNKIRIALSPTYNCHGLTFASRRTQVDPSSIKMILEDDAYVELERRQALPGDIIIYASEDGDITHSGIVVANEPPLYSPMVCSKWGLGPEMIHLFTDVHPMYGLSNMSFYRCRL